VLALGNMKMPTKSSDCLLKTVLASRAASIKPKSSPNGRRIGSDAFKNIQSHKTEVCDTTRKDTQQYTGNVIIGIATMHKSNAVPIINQQQAIEVAKMRRG